MIIKTNHLTGMPWIGTALLLAAGCSKAPEPPPPAAAASPAPPAEISIPGTGVFPESLTSSKDGTIYIGSVGKAQVYRVAPGASTAEPFIAPGTGGLKQPFGVFADDAANTLWVCSNEVSAGGPPGPKPGVINGLFSFDLASGAAKAHYDFPNGGMCNDIAVGGNGDVYATDTQGMQIVRLPKGGSALEVWSGKGAFGPAGGVLDGIAVVGNRVIANTLLTSKLFAVEVGADGKAGKVTELKLTAPGAAAAAPTPPPAEAGKAGAAGAPEPVLPLTRPDGMRAWGTDGLLSTDGTGKIQHVVINGDSAEVHTVKDGLDGVVAVTTVGDHAYALEGQLGIMMAAPGTTPPAEKPYRAVGFALP